jgi:thiamine pyrophosphokinase
MIVCCDGAAGKLVAYGREPDAIVGDLDSLSPELKERFQDRLFADSGQETNDLTKAVNWCVAQDIKEVKILGATGLREDHTIGNISLLPDYCLMVKAVMFTDTGSFEAYRETVTLASFPGQQVSVFSINPDLPVTSSGLRYPLQELKLSSWWRGTLNEATDRNFKLSFTDGSVIVFKEYHENE